MFNPRPSFELLLLDPHALDLRKHLCEQCAERVCQINYSNSCNEPGRNKVFLSINRVNRDRQTGSDEHTLPNQTLSCPILCGVVSLLGTWFVNASNGTIRQHSDLGSTGTDEKSGQPDP